MEADLRHHLLSCAVAFSDAKGMKIVTVARLATGDWRFFDRIETGASFTARKYDEIMSWFAAKWPDGAVWPTDVPRPEVQEAA